MTDACRDWRGAIGAAALGRIDSAEEIALRAHLDGCAACRAELDELSAAARALDAVTIESVVGAPTEPPTELAGQVIARVGREREAIRRRRTRRIAAGVAACAGVAAAVIAVVLFVGSGSSGGTRVDIRGTGGATASATLHDHAAGTEIEMKVEGLDPERYYWLWLTGDNEKRRVGAGTFTGSTEPARIRFTAALALDKTRRIWVTDKDDHVVLDARVPSDS